MFNKYFYKLKLKEIKQYKENKPILNGVKL